MPLKPFTQEEFLRRSREAHGDKYDYSKAVYAGSSKKVTIICPEHGEFDQRAGSHMSGMGCKKCAAAKVAETRDTAHRRERYEATMMERYGVAYPAQSPEIAKKTADTLEERYGSRSLMGSPELRAKREQSLLDRYGDTSPMRIELFRQKIRRTNRARYGVPYAGCSKEAHEKSKQTCLKRFGAESWSQSDDADRRRPEIIAKMKATSLDRYGCENALQAPEMRKRMSEITSSKEYQDKVRATKHKNGSFITSGPEEKMYDVLVHIYGEDDVVRQYHDDRYPFACDFYIKSRDMFIEANISWTHGFMWFDESSSVCKKRLHEWKRKSKSSTFYANAIDVWTRRDVLKRNTAKANDLNYVVIWKNHATDFDDWVLEGCPDRKDWM